MPTKAVSGSLTVEVIGFRAAFDLILGNLTVNLSPMVWKAGGAAAVLGAKIVIVSPSGQIMASGAGYSFTPPTMGQSLILSLPLFGGVYEWGTYRFLLTIVQADNSTIILEDSFDLCAPYSVDRNTGVAQLRLDADCSLNVFRVYGGEGYAYNGKTASAWAKAYTFHYPAGSGQASVAFNVLPAQLSLFSGMSKVVGTSDGTFLMDRNYEVKVRFLADEERYVQCNFPCHLWCAYQKLVEETADPACGTKQYRINWEKLQQCSIYVPLILLGIRCNKNVDEYIATLETVLDAKNCPCGDDESVLLGVAQAAPTTTTTTQAPIMLEVTTAPPATTTPPTTTVPPTTTTTTLPCPEVTDIQYTFI